jgi:GTPase
LHVRDISHAETDAQAQDVEQVLTGLGIDVVPDSSPILEVWNKVDLLGRVSREEAVGPSRWAERRPALVSAVTGEGVEELLDAIDRRLGIADEILDLTVPAHEGRLIAWLYENCDVLSRTANEETAALVFKLRLATEKKGRLLSALAKAGIAL